MKENIFVYIGGLTSCEKGAVGTHTKGIVRAFVDEKIYDKYFLIGSKIGCFEDISGLNLVDLTHVGEPQGSIFKKNNFYKFYAKTIIDKIIEIKTNNQNCFITFYMRYSLRVTKYVINKILELDKYKFILEYNDLTTDQIKFSARNGQWSKIGNMIRTNPFILKKIEHEENYCFKNSTLTVCVTDKLRDYVLSLNKSSKAIVVENATESYLIKKYLKENKNTLREELGYSEETFLFCHVGTLTYWDGLEEFILALSKTKNLKNIKFLIVGDGSLKSRLLELVQNLKLTDSVNFTSAVPYHLAVKYVYIADVIPLLKTITTYQLSPIKYYEAMGLGKFILASDAAYINNVLNNDIGDVVSLPLDIDEVANKIDELYDKRKFIKDKSSQISEFAMKHHTWNSRVQQILKFFNK